MMEEGREPTENQNELEGQIATNALQATSETLPSTEFVKVEKNLASLGFFTPSSKRLRNAQEKSFTITTVTDGTRQELKGTIIPSAKYGLPITADQDKWIALCKILNDIMQKEGSVTNPVSFTSAEILRLLHKHRHSGKNYREIEEWLDVLFSTTIFSEGVVYLASEKRRVKDRYRVFDRAVSFGKELSDGKVADKNYVWFSDWQLQNINSNHLLPIDLEAYRELKNHIAKALVPLLQVWLYATRETGIFEKRYEELCQFLNIQRYRYVSLITRTLGPSLDELTEVGYLSDWKVERTSNRENYKVIFYHGEKFHRDHRARLKKKEAAEPMGERRSPVGTGNGDRMARDASPRSAHGERKLEPVINEEYLAELLKRGVTDIHARKILTGISPAQPIIAQLEWGDLQVRKSGGKIANPAGFYVSLVSGNVTPPPNFETNAQRKIREEEDARRESEREAQQDLEAEYEWYRSDEIDHYIATLDPAEVSAVLEAKREFYRAKYQTEWMIEDFAKQDMKRELAKCAPLLTIEEFKVAQTNGSLSILKPVCDSPVGAPEGSELPVIQLPEKSNGTPESEAVLGAEAAQLSATGSGGEMTPSSEEPFVMILESPVELASEPPAREPETHQGELEEHLA